MVRSKGAVKRLTLRIGSGPSLLRPPARFLFPRAGPPERKLAIGQSNLAASLGDDLRHLPLGPEPVDESINNESFGARVGDETHEPRITFCQCQHVCQKG